MTVETLDSTHAEVIWFDDRGDCYQRRVGLYSLEPTSSAKPESEKSETDLTTTTVSCPDCAAKLEIGVKFLEHRV